MIRVYHADDHAVVREGIKGLLMTEPDMQLVGSAENGIIAARQVAALRPDVIVIDLHMPRQSGIETIRQIKGAWPQASILVLTSFAGDEEVFPAIQAGASGYILKDSSPRELLQAIRDVHAGKSSLDPYVARKVIDQLKKPSSLPLSPEPLTEREVEILRLVAQGMTNQDIAEKLVVSERTIRTHVSNILAKLHLANRTQAALHALRHGLATLDDAEK